ncbi:hypothetical protein [Mesobacillus sp. S13]|uniref:hypothetical protein n=1 Tax=Mesobacillus sp. S13 TaxID=2880221 RepID=UPI001CF51013|nr:hypothetical protein [Mesobacillus sp. S13]
MKSEKDGKYQESSYRGTNLQTGLKEKAKSCQKKGQLKTGLKGKAEKLSEVSPT